MTDLEKLLVEKRSDASEDSRELMEIAPPEATGPWIEWSSRLEAALRTAVAEAEDKIHSNVTLCGLGYEEQQEALIDFRGAIEAALVGKPPEGAEGEK